MFQKINDKVKIATFSLASFAALPGCATKYQDPDVVGIPKNALFQEMPLGVFLTHSAELKGQFVTFSGQLSDPVGAVAIRDDMNLSAKSKYFILYKLKVDEANGQSAAISVLSQKIFSAGFKNIKGVAGNSSELEDILGAEKVEKLVGRGIPFILVP